ncbi:hypothetical protein Tco_1504252 [Tanacetum coccineum]
METINVKFDELTGMASELDCLEPDLQRFNNQNSSSDLMNTPSKEDLDNLFGPMFEDYFEQKSSDTTINSAAQPTHNQEDSPSTSSIIVDTHEAPPVVTTSDEQNSPISLQESDEFNQEDSADFDAAKQQRFAQKVQQQNETLTSQIEMYKERNWVLDNITKDNNYLKEFLEADERAKHADHAGYKDDYKSTSGGVQFLGVKLVSWSSKKQDCTAMSTTKVEYVSLSACCAQVIWMRTQLLDYGFKYNRIPMY